MGMGNQKGNFVLVDSNVFIDLIRAKKNPVQILDSWKEKRQFLTCGMVRLEVERGITDHGVRSYMSGYFDVMRFVPTTNQIWAKAVQLAWSLDRKGCVLPGPDVLIAIHALAFKASVLTSDHHFDSIPGLTVLKPEEELER